jgi:hypothetical protein
MDILGSSLQGNKKHPMDSTPSAIVCLNVLRYGVKFKFWYILSGFKFSCSGSDCKAAATNLKTPSSPAVVWNFIGRTPELLD